MPPLLKYTKHQTIASDRLCLEGFFSIIVQLHLHAYNITENVNIYL